MKAKNAAQTADLGPLHSHLGHFRGAGVLNAGHNTMGVVKPRKRGQKAIKFHEGGLHASTGTPAGKPIPAKKMAAARSGKLGVKAERQALFKENVLTGRKKK